MRQSEALQGEETIRVWKERVNGLGKAGKPFLFIIDFDVKRPLCFELDALPAFIRYSLHGKNIPVRHPVLTVHPLPYEEYLNEFRKVQQHLALGNSFLVNLTVETAVESNLSLTGIFDTAVAPYKLLYEPHFVVFSPETFVTINDSGKISTFPMKGTIPADIPDADSLIINNDKEASEHATVVDLLRNDLSLVAGGVQLEEYRYIQKIKRRAGDLLQVSSKISGQLADGWQALVGDILLKMLPAGSVTGAPKKKTVEIIREVETHQRGYYTGIFGIFDGKSLDSAVMIRFIEQRQGKLFYKSGGGITFLSDPESEYKEVLEKIYVPVG